MTATTDQPNGHAGSPSVGPAPSPAGGSEDKDKPKEKALLLTPDTHRMVRTTAKRLGRPNDAVVRRAMHLLNKETAGEQAQTHTDWADEVAS